MRKGLTLIELILSMVIIAVVFTVIPRLIHSMNQTASTAIKEEAMYNAMTLMGAIINLPWDENNTQNDPILRVTQGDSTYECNTTSGYRVGGFIGGRQCRPLSDGTILQASAIGVEGGDLNDLDDYTLPIESDNNCSRAAGKKLYTLTPLVTYVNDPSPTGEATLSDTNLTAGKTSNTKRIVVRVGYHADNRHTGCITALEYHALNIGQIHINSRGW